MPDEVPRNTIPGLLTQVSAIGNHPGVQPRVSWKDRVLRLGDMPGESRWRGIWVSLGITGLITIVGSRIEPVIGGPNVAILYMLAVVLGAVRWGRRVIIINAISSALLFDYFFVVPYRSFVIRDSWYLITLVGLLTIGLIVSALTVTAREEARAARKREARVAALYSFTRSLALKNEMDHILDVVARHFFDVFQRPLVVFLPDRGSVSVRFSSPNLILDGEEKEIASWVYQNGQEAGFGTKVFPGSKIRYRPLTGGNGIVGVIGIQIAVSREPLPPDQHELLSVFMNQTALAITRADFAEKARHAEILQETDKLQKALLNSVSHNLRTPLASVLGALSAVLEDGSLLDVPTQQSLLRTAQGEAQQLDWLVQNLLDMTRLEGGTIRVKAEPCDVHDIVADALGQLGEGARSREISVTIPPSLPLVRMDDVLMVQVLVNLLDNALKYSPAEAPVEIRARLDAGHLEVQVLDQGRGIPEDELERVFDKFYRGAIPGAPKGTGLGLSICKGFVEAHNGRILAKRRPEGGTELVVCLPLEGER